MKFEFSKYNGKMYLNNSLLPQKFGVMSENYLVIQADDVFHSADEPQDGDASEGTTIFFKRREKIKEAVKKSKL